MGDSRDKLITGIFALVMGLIILLAAFGFGPMADSAMHAPRWLIGIVGMVFLSGGVMLFDAFNRIAGLMAGLATVGMTVICGWVSLFGEDEYFSGGLSIFSESTEVLIARAMFGLVAALGGAITIHALRKKRVKKDA